MLNWFRDVAKDLWDLIRLPYVVLIRNSESTPPGEHRLRRWGIVSATTLVTLVIVIAAYWPTGIKLPLLPVLDSKPEYDVRIVDITKPVREEPKRFKINSHLPNKTEGSTSVPIAKAAFSAKRDLIQIDDRRVWWESEHDKNDTEDDHLFHPAMEEPMLRLFELVHKEGATLKVQDAYRAKGVHSLKSLHKQGRAVDLTAEGITLEKLAKLCWAAGFDWVYNEWPKRGGAHVHASVRPDLGPPGVVLYEKPGT